MIQYKNKSGFTLVELTLALAFVSILLISVATTTIQLGQTYNRGLTIKAVNQAGRAITSDLQRTINSSLTVNTASLNYYINPVGGNGGRLCLGSYSYIWNYGKSLNAGSYTNKYTVNTNNKIRFVKVADTGGSYCTSPNSTIDDTKSTELLNVGDRELAIQSFVINNENTGNRDAVTNSRLYYITLTIGTNKDSELETSYLRCKDPGVSGSNLTYCTVEAFAISLTTGNTTSQ